MNIKTRYAGKGKGSLHLVFDFGDGDVSHTALCGKHVERWGATYNVPFGQHVCKRCVAASKNHDLRAAYIGALSGELYGDRFTAWAVSEYTKQLAAELDTRELWARERRRRIDAEKLAKDAAR